MSSSNVIQSNSSTTSGMLSTGSSDVFSAQWQHQRLTPYHMVVVNVAACFLIGITSMASLFLFNILIHRRNPFVTPKPSTTTNGSVSNGVTKCPVVNPSIINDPSKSEILKTVLSFAVGGLLGDVFLHLLPEAGVQLARLGYSTLEAQQYLGVWILTGVILFVAFESAFVQFHGSSEPKVKAKTEPEEEENPHYSNGFVPNGTTMTNGELRHRNGGHQIMNGNAGKAVPIKPSSTPDTDVINVTGYLNLVANGFDNFTHGMSVGASFLVSFKVGCLTTLAIAIHEIPHEIVDYVILLRSGFACWAAFRAQLSISLVTVLGALTVLYFDSATDPLSYTLWILPFTAGGFIYIALTSLLPELVHFEDEDSEEVSNETIQKTSMFSGLRNIGRLASRLAFVLAGIGIMAAMNVIDLF